MKDRRLIYLITSCIAFALMWFIVPVIEIGNSLAASIAVGLLVTVAFMFVQLSIVRWFTSLTVKPIWAFLTILISACLWFGLVFMTAAPYIPYATQKHGVRVLKIGKDIPEKAPYRANVKLTPILKNAKGEAVPGKPIKVPAVRQNPSMGFKLFVFNKVAGWTRVATSILMILAATAFGYLASFMLRSTSIVLPIAIFAAFIDIWTVFFGFTANFIKNAPHVVDSVSVAIPQTGSAIKGAAAPMSFIGPADFIFLALFFGAIYRLKMNPTRTFWIALPLLTLGMLVPMLLNIDGFPGLIVIGLSVILGNIGHFKLKRDEYISIGIVALILIIASLVITPLISGKHN